MGLDLVVEGCARPGHEAEWRRMLERSFGNEEPTEADEARFAEISIPPFERVGAPRVGYDSSADAWIVKARNASAPAEVADTLKEFHGYHVLRLAACDGVPEYSHGGLYEGVDETSFRGAFLSDCNDVLAPGLVDEAWVHKLPEDAIRYGRALLAAASGVAATGAVSKRGLLSRLGWTKKATDSMPLQQQLKIVEAAGKWFVFWGERGHAIRAWF